jgi:hypothetical protein
MVRQFTELGDQIGDLLIYGMPLEGRHGVLINSLDDHTEPLAPKTPQIAFLLI